jgi:hypothetical protein
MAGEIDGSDIDRSEIVYSEAIATLDQLSTLSKPS